MERLGPAHLPGHRLVARDAKGRRRAALTPISRRAVDAGVADLSVYVAAAARGHGVGRALLTALVDSARSGGLWTLQAGVFPENQASLALHRSAGFREVGVRERIGQLEGVGEDVVLLELRPVKEVRASGLEYLALATELLQRARLADPEAGLWEAADLQRWAHSRRSDAIDQHFWLDDEGPIAAVVLTDWRRAWGCDLLRVSADTTPPLPVVLERAVDAIESHELDAVEMLVRDDDLELPGLLADTGFAPGDEWSGAHLDGQRGTAGRDPPTGGVPARGPHRHTVRAAPDATTKR